VHLGPELTSSSGFISDTWQVTSGGMFAGSCIGVISLVISLEFLRRVQREYDGWIARKDRKMIADYNRRHDLDASSGSSVQNSNGKGPIVSTPPVTASVSAPPRVDRPTLLQRQVIRSLLHMVQFGVAYFIMLLAMYFNGMSSSQSKGC
jgi:copper transporter 1